MTLPPKIVDFRISRREINHRSPDGEGILRRKIPGRVMTLPYDFILLSFLQW